MSNFLFFIGFLMMIEGSTNINPYFLIYKETELQLSQESCTYIEHVSVHNNRNQLVHLWLSQKIGKSCFLGV